MHLLGKSGGFVCYGRYTPNRRGPAGWAQCQWVGLFFVWSRLCDHSGDPWRIRCRHGRPWRLSKREGRRGLLSRVRSRERESSWQGERTLLVSFAPLGDEKGLRYPVVVRARLLRLGDFLILKSLYSRQPSQLLGQLGWSGGPRAIAGGIRHRLGSGVESVGRSGEDPGGTCPKAHRKVGRRRVASRAR